MTTTRPTIQQTRRRSRVPRQPTRATSHARIHPETIQQVVLTLARRMEGPVTERLPPDQEQQLRAVVDHGWQAGALCASADPTAWFPAKGHGAVPQVFTVCAGCPV